MEGRSHGPHPASRGDPRRSGVARRGRRGPRGRVRTMARPIEATLQLRLLDVLGDGALERPNSRDGHAARVRAATRLVVYGSPEAPPEPQPEEDDGGMAGSPCGCPALEGAIEAAADAARSRSTRGSSGGASALNRRAKSRRGAATGSRASPAVRTQEGTMRQVYDTPTASGRAPTERRRHRGRVPTPTTPSRSTATSRRLPVPLRPCAGGHRLTIEHKVKRKWFAIGRASTSVSSSRPARVDGSGGARTGAAARSARCPSRPDRVTWFEDVTGDVGSPARAATSRRSVGGHLASRARAATSRGHDRRRRDRAARPATSGSAGRRRDDRHRRFRRRRAAAVGPGR